MAFDAFSGPWATAWASALNASEAYRTAAADWEGPIGLVLGGASSPLERAVILDLWHGRCRSARAGGPEILDGAAYVFEGDQEAWRQILLGGGSPILALMTGKIRLTRGHLSALLPFVRAAKELLGLATQVPVRFPEG